MKNLQLPRPMLQRKRQRLKPPRSPEIISLLSDSDDSEEKPSSSNVRTQAKPFEKKAAPLQNVDGNAQDKRNFKARRISASNALLQKIKKQEERQNILKSLEKQYAQMDNPKRQNSISRGICAKALEIGFEKMDGKVAQLTSQLDTDGSLTEDKLSIIEKDFLDSIKEDFDFDVSFAQDKHSKSHWKELADTVEDAFVHLKISALKNYEKIVISELDALHAHRFQADYDIEDLERKLSAKRKFTKAQRKKVANLKTQCRQLDAKITAKTKDMKAEDGDDANECNICFEETLDTALSCGHLLGRKCAGKLSKCPLCSKEIKFIIEMRG
eukprot:CAMPEP_0114486814 /NCGR_PEP_ID=MMETSP0109-20121206/422_1 /TAXON_ID=29199 /ORGANISM="Chlorarachnion reptans, Strain CCCM449" /LENGTH=326 /DNA_ID=CAMNT_0001663015 /DNA_START=154 /DNA_END=1134 /DNA_ORIENTATION=+